MRNTVCSNMVGSNPSRIGVAAMALILTLAAAPMALAEDDKTEAAREVAAVAGAKLTLSQAIEAAQKEVPDAKILEAEVDTVSGAPSYVVKVDKDGAQWLVFDLRTGQMTKVAAENDDDASNDDSANRNEDEDEDEDEGDE